MADNIPLASAYRLQAVNFWESAKILAASFDTPENTQPKNLLTLPFYFLISHAAELFLKSALLKRGVEPADLKKFEYRHNLLALLEEIKGRGVTVTSETALTVEGLHRQHQTHALRYTALVDDGEKTYMPPPSFAFAMLEELLMLTRISTQGI